ncbi:ATP-dependent Clp protease proteolytic subunit [Mesorhizobium sp. 113-3-9]|uniref:head maturation protease, ClpP-related n=1 Tax=Mesorhizobium sp. 113-3-9 TaxID=2744517 RepID=UPI00192591AD|nr:head maturation protease, ClpP-related [Mesorhizobium sp. 113-3-9]BCG85331.1 ATP-dependent Clp protease proteolytic subunit [Mesorhizobium sp. 113-3-9]
MNKPLKFPSLYLSGYVGDEITDAATRQFLDAQPAGQAVNVYINSPGGVAFEGIAIYNTLAQHSGPVTVVVNGVAASAASLIAMAGNKIVMLAGAMMMIHDPSGLTFGPSSLHYRAAEMLDQLGDQVAGIYAARTGLPKSQILSMMSDESWMTGDDAVELGFADHASTETSEKPKMSASDAALFTKTPAALMQRAQTEEPEMNIALPAARDTYKAIMAVCRAANLSAADTDEIFDKADGDVAKAKTLVVDMLATRNTDTASSQMNAGPVGPTQERQSALAATIGAALYARMSGKPATGEAKDWAGASILDMGAALLEARGEKILSRNKDRLAKQITMSGGMHTTSDFVNLTGSAGQRILLEAYEAAGSPLKQLARNRNANDFRAIAMLRLGEMPALLEVPEGAEVKYGSRAESAEGYRLRTFARIFALSRQAIINDDLDAFADTARAWGRAAAELEASELVALILANSGAGPTMEDGNPLYHASHGNKAASGTAIDIAGLSAGRKALRDMKGLDGKTPISVTAKYLVVGSAKETEAEQVLATLTPATVSDTNPFSGKLTLLVEPRLPGNAWRLFSDPAQAPVLDIAYLNGEAGPQVETRDGWEVLGAQYRAVLDFGCGVSGWRGTYLNPGN